MKVLLVVLLLNSSGEEIKRHEQEVPNMVICRYVEESVKDDLTPLTFDGKTKLKTVCQSTSLALLGQKY